MSAVITTTKRSALLVLLQANPDILTADSSYVGQLLDRAIEWMVSRLKFTRYPELAQGYSQSGASPSTDISGINTNELEISVNGSLRVIITPTLSSMATGADIATELQRVIRADSSDGFDEVTVAFADSLYTITSGRNGAGSSIILGFTETNKAVAQNLKFTPEFGGVEFPGMEAQVEVDGLVVGLTEHYYRMIGIEGAAAASVPGGVNVSNIGIPKWILSGMNAKRRLWT